MADWRLFNQKNYLKDQRLKFQSFVIEHESWDHDHCSFCFARISPYDIEVAYCTEDGHHWICPDCYEDFKDQFNWTLIKE